jgi:hypothetical protein
MNERILELAHQARAESSQWLGSKPATTITYDELEKFAELIVRECISLVNLRQRFAVEDELNAEHAFDILVYDIEQHFGVEP